MLMKVNSLTVVSTIRITAINKLSRAKRQSQNLKDNRMTKKAPIQDREQ